jgi:hypothetical protein
MSLKWIDGFDTYTSAALINRKYASGDMGASKLELGRSGFGKSLVFVGPVNPATATEFVTPDLGNHNTWVVGFAFAHKMPAEEFTLLELRDSSLVQVDLRFDPGTEKFRVFSNGVAIGTGITRVNTGTWYYVELKVVVHNSAGTVELRVNEGVDLSLANVKTQNTSNTFANRLAFKKPAGYYTQYMLDDMYVLDGAGTINNDFLGDMKVEVIRPSGPGATTQWTPQPGGANWEAVDQDDNSWVQASAAGSLDTYAFGDLQNISGNIAGVAVTVYAKNSDAFGHRVKSVIRSGGVDTEAPTAQSVTDISYHYKSFITERDPNTTAPWTVSGVNGAEYGVKLVGGIRAGAASPKGVSSLMATAAIV